MSDIIQITSDLFFAAANFCKTIAYKKRVRLVRFSVIQSVTQNVGLFVPQGYVPQKRMCGMGEAKKRCVPRNVGRTARQMEYVLAGLQKPRPQKSAV